MLNLRKSVLTGAVVIVIGAGWLAKTVAQERSSAPAQEKSSPELVAKTLKTTGPVIYINHENVATSDREESNEIDTPHAHANFTGVVYVVSGEATFIVAGTCGGGRNYAREPDRFGGQSLEGGDSHLISAGDLLIVPPGCPHWYKNAKALHYFIVEVPQRPVRPAGVRPTE
jgi:mannose-6-phosphate isomerase-like protein (cupin superfamily)